MEQNGERIYHERIFMMQKKDVQWWVVPYGGMHDVREVDDASILQAWEGAQAR